MNIEYDFRSDMTVCELLQYLHDLVQIRARYTDVMIAKNCEHWQLKLAMESENRISDLINDICLQASHVDREV